MFNILSVVLLLISWNIKVGEKAAQRQNFFFFPPTLNKINDTLFSFLISVLDRRFLFILFLFVCLFG